VLPSSCQLAELKEVDHEGYSRECSDIFINIYSFSIEQLSIGVRHQIH
jgi:hypothetical protein